MPSAEALDRLFAVSPDRFVAERDALARQLRDDGRRDEADDVKRLRKPPVTVWVLNRLARDRPDDVRALADAAERLAGGEADADGDFRRSLDLLVRAARGAADDVGASASDALLDRVGALLRTAAADPGAREELVHGRLIGEPELTGFEAMRGATLRPPSRPSKAATGATKTEKMRGERDDLEEARAHRKRVEEARARVAEARSQARDLQRRADAAEREARRARKAAERADAEVQTAEERLRALTRT